MQAYEPIKLACKLINLSAEETEIDSYLLAVAGGDTFSYSSSMLETKIKKLINVLNLTVARISTEYFCFKNTEEMTSDGSGKIYYSGFSKTAYEVVMVCDVSSKAKVNIEIYPTYILVSKKNAKYDVTYRYVPQSVLALGDTLEIFPSVDARAICYGMCSDICLAKNLFDEANMWEQKFKSALAVAVRGRKEKLLFKRNLL